MGERLLCAMVSRPGVTGRNRDATSAMLLIMLRWCCRCCCSASSSPRLILGEGNALCDHSQSRYDYCVEREIKLFVAALRKQQQRSADVGLCSALLILEDAKSEEEIRRNGFLPRQRQQFLTFLERLFCLAPLEAPSGWTSNDHIRLEAVRFLT